MCEYCVTICGGEMVRDVMENCCLFLLDGSGTEKKDRIWLRSSLRALLSFYLSTSHVEFFFAPTRLMYPFSVRDINVLCTVLTVLATLSAISSREIVESCFNTASTAYSDIFSASP